MPTRPRIIEPRFTSHTISLSLCSYDLFLSAAFLQSWPREEKKRRIRLFLPFFLSFSSIRGGLILRSTSPPGFSVCVCRSLARHSVSHGARIRRKKVTLFQCWCIKEITLLFLRLSNAICQMKACFFIERRIIYVCRLEKNCTWQQRGQGISENKNSTLIINSSVSYLKRTEDNWNYQ